jgi:tetratricopeptide (TPR) repeat protein
VWVLTIFAVFSCNLRALASSPGWGRGSQEARGTFADAAAAYRAGDYETARTLWLEVLREEQPTVERASVLYDLGNVAWREGRALEAAAWYTACIREAPRHGDAWNNLEFVRSEAGLEPADRGDLLSTLRRLLGAFTPAEAEWFAVACTGLLALTLALEALRGGALFRRLSFAALVLLALGLVPWLWSLVQSGGSPVFVVANDGAALRSQPAEGGTVVGRLLPGSEADRIDSLPGWVRVERADGARGWVAADEVVPITSPFLSGDSDSSGSPGE